MSLTIRAAQFPQDYPAIAAVLADENPGWADTAEELAYAAAIRDPRYYYTAFVAEETSGEAPYMIGVAFAGHDTFAHQEGKFNIDLRVRPDWQGRGVGKALYQALLDYLAPMGPQELWALVWQAHPRAPRFLAERGFAETWRRIDWVLAVENFDFTPYTGLEENLQAEEITIKSYAELAGEPNRLEKLYELDWALWQSVPYGQTVTKRSLEQFAAEMVYQLDYLPEACFIALKAGEFIGYSTLSMTEQGFNTEMTGVLPTYRKRGVATLLKLYGIRYAQRHGNGRLDTQNDAVNEAMLALNEKLGFVREGATLRFMKRIL
jgi:GNAT superfamily N-acetyltransferase